MLTPFTWFSLSRLCVFMLLLVPAGVAVLGVVMSLLTSLSPSATSTGTRPMPDNPDIVFSIICVIKLFRPSSVNVAP